VEKDETTLLKEAMTSLQVVKTWPAQVRLVTKQEPGNPKSTDNGGSAPSEKIGDPEHHDP
jgi:hypothetical protein